MKLWKWQPGRQQGCEYKKFPLWFFRIGKFGLDAYILKYAPNTSLPWHKDPVDGKHWRKNFTLKGDSTFRIKTVHNSTISIRGGDYEMFRPDLEEHALDVHNAGCTKLSFGFVKFN